MKRLLKSSRWQAIIAAIAACVAIAFGAPDEQADQLSELLMKIIALLVTIGAGGTAAEDFARNIKLGASEKPAAQKFAGKVGNKRNARTPSSSASALVVLMSAIAVLAGNGACTSMTLPGWDTRQAHMAKNHMRWTGDDDVEINDETTHRGTTIMAAGEVALKDDGTIDTENSYLSSYFYRKTDPEQVAGSYQHLAGQNAQVAISGFGLLGEVMREYFALRRATGGSGGGEASADAGGIAEAIRELRDDVQTIKKLLPTAPP